METPLYLQAKLDNTLQFQCTLCNFKVEARVGRNIFLEHVQAAGHTARVRAEGWHDEADWRARLAWAGRTGCPCHSESDAETAGRGFVRHQQTEAHRRWVARQRLPPALERFCCDPQTPALVDSRHGELLALLTRTDVSQARSSEARRAVLAGLASGIAAAAPESELLLFGSTATGLWTEDSDLDLLLTLPPAADASREAVLLLLQSLAEQLRLAQPGAIAEAVEGEETEAEGASYARPAPITGLEVIPARVPILRGCWGGIWFDICTDPGGRRNSLLLASVFARHPTVRSLTVILRRWAAVHLHSLLTSYCLSLLVIFFAQAKLNLPPLEILVSADLSSATEAGTDEASLPELVATFLEFYHNFPFDSACVSPRLARALPLADLAFTGSLMYVEDPLEPALNCARVIGPAERAAVLAALRRGLEDLLAGRGWLQ